VNLTKNNLVIEYQTISVKKLSSYRQKTILVTQYFEVVFLSFVLRLMQEIETVFIIVTNVMKDIKND